MKLKDPKEGTDSVATREDAAREDLRAKLFDPPKGS